MSGDLERRYRRVLRLLPGYYRRLWEEDMVTAFLDSSLTGDPAEDEFVNQYGRLGWREIASVAGLAIRLYLGGVGAPRRYFTWGQAVRDAVLVVTLGHATQALGSFAVLAWKHRVFGLAVAPAQLVTQQWEGIWAGTWYAVGYGWIVAYIALALGYRRTAQVIAALAIVPDLIYLLHYPGPWAGWILFDLVPVLAMAAFHSTAPPVARRRWLLALPVSFALVAVPVMAIQASGGVRWLDQPGLFCILVAVACVVHALVAGGRSGEWSLTLILLATAAGLYQIASLIAHPQTLRAGLVELLLMAVAVAVDGHSVIAAWRPLDLRRPARLLSVLGVAVLVVALGAAGRWHSGTTTGGLTTRPSQAVASIVVAAMVSQPQTPAGDCPAGYARISAPGFDNSSLCFRPDGAPATITATDVTWNSLDTGYQFIVTVPAGEAAALDAVTAAAYDAHGFTEITVDGKTWELGRPVTPHTNGQFLIQIPDKNAGDQLLRILVPSSQ